MPYFTHNRWYAQRQREGDKFYLGSFPTKQAATQRELLFDKNWPSNRGKNLKGAS